MAAQGHPVNHESSVTSAHRPRPAEHREESIFASLHLCFFVKFTLSLCFERIVKSLCLPRLCLVA